MKSLYFIILIVLYNAVTSNGLSCIPCTELHVKRCQPPEKLGCKFGIGKDVCNCCPACLRGENESCGGIWNMDGHCADGLKCSCAGKDIDGTCLPGLSLPFIPYEYSICYRNSLN